MVLIEDKLHATSRVPRHRASCPTLVAYFLKPVLVANGGLVRYALRTLPWIIDRVGPRLVAGGSTGSAARALRVGGQPWISPGDDEVRLSR